MSKAGSDTAAAPESDSRAQPLALIVDDDPDMLALFARWAQSAGFRVVTCESGEAALTRLDMERPAVLITDLVMDRMDGLRLLTAAHRDDPVLPVIMVSGHAALDDAMRAAHLGATAFLTKPLAREAFVAELERVMQRAGTDTSTSTSTQDIEANLRFAPDLIYRSRAMSALIERARLVAKVDSAVLITGATGTGKEVLATAIHEASARRDKPFVTVNCGAIPDQLLESELFGHEKGAFTGATARHDGLFRAAQGGTLLLDEIGDMPLALQAKLLRVLQDFKVRPVGSTASYAVDVRVISATHRDLPVAVADGSFREDLYYRLGVVPLHIPNLEQRREDIAPIVEHLLARLQDRYSGERKRFAPDAAELLASVAWPGNVRQLANVVEQCFVLSQTPLISAELVKQALASRPTDIVPLEEAKRQFERRYLISVMRVTHGNVPDAARISGRNRTEFYKLLNKHELSATEFRDGSDEEDSA